MSPNPWFLSRDSMHISMEGHPDVHVGVLPSSLKGTL